MNIDREKQARVTQESLLHIKWGADWQIATWISAIIFIAVAVWSYSLSSNSWLAEAMLTSVALFSLYSIFVMLRSSVTWNEDVIYGADFTGRRSELHWNNIKHIQFVDWAMALKLQDSKNQTICIFVYMEGFDSISPKINAELKRLGLPILTKKLE